ncbi:NAD(P)-binding protein [Nemania sp. NC0429]|nr:NAD(P)-binding protein [Nemania sp. NC0429]
MSSYLVTGASRGIGFEFLRKLSEDPNNVVVGLVRDKASTDKKVLAEINRPNIHIVQADLVDYDSLKASFDVVAPIVNGSLDYIIANAALISQFSSYDPIGTLGQKDPKGLEADFLESFKVNVIGNVHLFNIYLPLILKGRAKKVMTISSGMADLGLIRDYKVALAAPYSVSKAGINTAVGKFHAQYADQGVLFFSICPGVVSTGLYDDATEEQMKAVAEQGAAFQRYAPGFKGAATTAESVDQVLAQLYKASLEGGYGGDFISHLGKGEKWL